MVRYPAYLETAYDGRGLAHVLDLPGCILMAPANRRDGYREDDANGVLTGLESAADRREFRFDQGPVGHPLGRGRSRRMARGCGAARGVSRRVAKRGRENVQ